MKTTRKKISEHKRKSSRPKSQKAKKNNPAKVSLTARPGDLNQREKVAKFLQTNTQVLNSMTEGVNFIDSQGIIRYTNPAFDAMFDYEASSLIGQHVSILNAATTAENDILIAKVIDALSKDKKFVGEFKNRKRDGTTFYTMAHVSTLRHSGKVWFVTVQDDITERKRNEMELFANQQQLRMIFNNVTNMQMLLEVTPDERLIIRAVNPSFLETTNKYGIKITAQDMIGKDRAEVWQMTGNPPELVDEWTRHYFQVLKSGVPAKFNEDVSTPSGILYLEAN